MSNQILQLEEEANDAKREIERQVELNKIAERQLEELRTHNATVQEKAETTLSASHASMEKILKDKRKWELQQEQYVAFKEKLKLAQTKIQSLETDLNERKEK